MSRCITYSLSNATIPIAGLLFILMIPGIAARAQGDTTWHGKKSAVCLTYDDALNVHLDNAVPLLDSMGFKATFYLSGFFPAFRERVVEWRGVAAKGHELGNHTLFHPCDGRPAGREWVKPDYDLNTYTKRRLIDEIVMANTLLQSIDGRSTRTFAYPCGDTRVGDSSYVEEVRRLFIAARGVQGKTETKSAIDLTNIGSFMIAGESGEELISLVRKAMKEKALVVFLFHGVGGEHNLNVSLEAHHQLLQFLKLNEEEIWIAPMVEIAQFLKENRGGN